MQTIILAIWIVIIILIIILETITLIIKNMLKENQDENTIIRFTNAKKEEIDEIKRELEMQAN